MSAMEPDEGTGTDAPRWEKTEAANPPEETDADAEAGTDDGDGDGSSDS